LESTHLQDAERLGRMVALLTIALCWAFKTGEWLSQHNPIKIKKHGRKAKSIFRVGLAQILHLSQQATFLTRKQGFEARETA
jgi:hypothetical protein